MKRNLHARFCRRADGVIHALSLSTLRVHTLAGQGDGRYDVGPQRQVRCPHGHLSQRWAFVVDRHRTDNIEVRFAARTCEGCVQADARRAGIEATISQAVRQTRMRRSPSRGIAKTHLHHVQIAAGVNVLCPVTRASLRVENALPVRLLVSKT